MLDHKLLEELKSYIELNQHFVTLEKSADIAFDRISPIELETFIKDKRKPTLQKVLFGFIDKKGTTDAEIYKKALIDRRHFSKIRSNPEYRPGKNTMIALALALELNKKETDRLLSSAGYALSESDTSDLIVQFFIEKKVFDLDEINQALVYFSLKPLGGVM